MSRKIDVPPHFYVFIHSTYSVGLLLCMSGTVRAKDYRSSNIEVLPSQAYILVGGTRERERENK